MDRKTLLAFGLIAVILILTPWYMSLVSPEPLEDKNAQPRPANVNANDNKSRPQKEGGSVPIVRSLKAPFTAQEQFVDINNGLFDVDLMAPVSADKELYIILSADRGLCGGFNSNILKYSYQKIKDLSSVDLVLFGRKAIQFYKNRDIC